MYELTGGDTEVRAKTKVVVDYFIEKYERLDCLVKVKVCTFI